MNIKRITPLAFLLCLLPAMALANTLGESDFTDIIFRANLENSSCPNHLIEDAEQCDDGNVTIGDGCNASCRLFQCGDSLLDAPFEQCDDGNTDALDGCDGRFCFTESGFHCIGAPSSCSAICGDGLIRGIETCDDDNLVNDDGCSVTCSAEVNWSCTGEPSTCVQTLFPEVEPNDDGTPSVGGFFIDGNDFGSPTIINSELQGITHLASGIRTWTGAINAAGDEDVYTLENNDNNGRRVRLDVWNQALGVGVACGNNLDTALNVRPSDAVGGLGAAQISNNGRDPLDRCPSLSFDLAAGQKRYAHLVAVNDNFATMPYVFIIESSPWACGNNRLEPGETCDDGNLANGDGCSSTCLRDGEVAEVEPNNTISEADGNGVEIGGSKVMVGSLTVATDAQDIFRVNNSAPAVVRFESFVSMFDCDFNTATTLRLLNQFGAQILQEVGVIGVSSGSGLLGCSAMVYPFETAGTHYIQIEESRANFGLPNYLLQAKFLTDAGIENDAPPKSNDGYSSADQNIYNLNLAGIYDAFVFGNHLTNGDLDYYIIRVPPGKGIRAEVIEGNRTEETCESGGIDSRLTLFDITGVNQLVDDDDDGRRFCSLIDGTGVTRQDPNAFNNTSDFKDYYLLVRASTFAQTVGDPNGQFKYRLVVTIR